MFSFEKMRQKIKTSGMTQTVFREKCGIGARTITAIMNDGSVTLETLDKIGTFFQCNPLELIEWIPESTNSVAENIKARKIKELEEQLRTLKNS